MDSVFHKPARQSIGGPTAMDPFDPPLPPELNWCCYNLTLSVSKIVRHSDDLFFMNVGSHEAAFVTCSVKTPTNVIRLSVTDAHFSKCRLVVHVSSGKGDKLTHLFQYVLPMSALRKHHLIDDNNASTNRTLVIDPRDETWFADHKLALKLPIDSERVKQLYRAH